MKDNEISEEYKIAVTEILMLLEKLEQNLVKKIPKKLITLWKTIEDKNYRLQCNFSQDIKQWQLSNKAKALLAMLYINYWCNDEEKIEYDKLLVQNEEKYQNELNNKYNVEDIFKNKNIKNEIQEQNDNLPIVYTNEKLYKKILNFIKKFFRKK